MTYWKMIIYISHRDSIMTTFWLSDVIREDVIYDRSGVLYWMTLLLYVYIYVL